MSETWEDLEACVACPLVVGLAAALLVAPSVMVHVSCHLGCAVFGQTFDGYWKSAFIGVWMEECLPWIVVPSDQSVVV